MKAKTRTNQPVYYFFESQQDMTKLSGSFLNSLVAGDIVVKQTGEQQHAYIVSYKQDGTGICLTYTDASVVETISYDYVGSNWVYNSTDVQSIDVEGLIEGGTISNAKPIYYHPVYVEVNNSEYTTRLMFNILDNNPTPYTVSTFLQKLKDLMDGYAKINIDGFIKTETYGTCFAFLGIKTGGSYRIFAVNSSGTQYSWVIDDIITAVDDGVNKIN